MTRKEEIIEAARSRAERHQITEMKVYGGDKCNYSYGRIYNSEMASFEAGAEWADEHSINVWHDASEEPKRGSLILLIMQSGTAIVAKIIEPNHTFNHGEKWAYISDLLPKE